MLVEVLEDASKLGGNRCCVGLRELLFGYDGREQILAVHIINDHVDSVDVLDHSMHFDYIRVIQLSQQIDFTRYHLVIALRQLKFPVELNSSALTGVDVMALPDLIQVSSSADSFRKRVVL